jgi:hypothetical protein
VCRFLIPDPTTLRDALLFSFALLFCNWSGTCMAFTDPTASNRSRMPFVMYMLVAPVLSRYLRPYTVSSHSPHFCQAPPPFIHVQINADAHNVCTRAKNHYDPQQVHNLFSSDIARTEDTPDRAMARRGGNTARDRANEFQSSFQQAHERQASRMYFL